MCTFAFVFVCPPHASRLSRWMACAKSHWGITFVGAANTEPPVELATADWVGGAVNGVRDLGHNGAGGAANGVGGGSVEPPMSDPEMRGSESATTNDEGRKHRRVVGLGPGVQTVGGLTNADDTAVSTTPHDDSEDLDDATSPRPLEPMELPARARPLWPKASGIAGTHGVVSDHGACAAPEHMGW